MSHSSKIVNYLYYQQTYYCVKSIFTPDTQYLGQGDQFKNVCCASCHIGGLGSISEIRLDPSQFLCYLPNPSIFLKTLPYHTVSPSDLKCLVTYIHGCKCLSFSCLYGSNIQERQKAKHKKADVFVVLEGMIHIIHELK